MYYCPNKQDKCIYTCQKKLEQKREEAQMLAEALIDAEVRIGDLLKKLPKAKNNMLVSAVNQALQNIKKRIIFY